MSETRLRLLAALTATALAVVIGVGAVVGSAAAADDLASRAEAQLASAGLDGVAVELRGREATISGGSAEDRVEARRVVAAIPGVRSVEVHAPRPDDGGDESGPATESRIVLRRTDSGATISGVVPDPDAQVRIRAAAAAAFGRLTGDLTVDRRADSSAWVDRIAGVLDGLADVEDLGIAIDGRGTLVLRGDVADAARREQVVQLVTATFPDLDVVDDHGKDG